MKILLALPNISEKTLKTAKQKLQEVISLSKSPIVKELGSLIIKALDYDPIDINFSDLEYFQAQYAESLEAQLTQLSEEDFEEKSLFWLAFYLHALQFETLTLKNAFNQNDLELGNFLETHFSSFPSDLQQRIRYISYKLGADIASRRILSVATKQIAVVKEEFKGVQEAVETIKGWDKNLESWEKKVNDQESRLREQLVKLNFVGLSNASQKLTAEKNTERTIHASISILIGIIFIITPLAIAWLYHRYTTQLPNFTNVTTLGPIVAFEFSLLYFFRVALQNYSSAKAQLLQLRLRFELCAFVEGYAEFIEPLRQKGGNDTLAKFENIVFSGISLDPQKVPSQFDGLENLLQLIKAVKSDK